MDWLPMTLLSLSSLMVARKSTPPSFMYLSIHCPTLLETRGWQALFDRRRSGVHEWDHGWEWTNKKGLGGLPAHFEAKVQWTRNPVHDPEPSSGSIAYILSCCSWECVILYIHLFKCYKCMMKGSLGNISYYSPFDIVFAIKVHFKSCDYSL